MKHACQTAKIFAILALFMNVSIHMLPAIAAATGQTQITICTAYEVRTIIIDENGNQVPAPLQNAKKQCSFCITANTDTIITNEFKITSAPPALQNKPWNAQAIIFKTTNNKSNPSRAPPQIS